jgi:hypothetical protein
LGITRVTFEALKGSFWKDLFCPRKNCLFPVKGLKVFSAKLEKQ